MARLVAALLAALAQFFAEAFAAVFAGCGRALLFGADRALFRGDGRRVLSANAPLQSHEHLLPLFGCQLTNGRRHMLVESRHHALACLPLSR